MLYPLNPVQARVALLLAVNVLINVIALPPPEGAEDDQVVPLDVNTLPLLPGETNCIVDDPLPSNTLLAVSDERPVPPLPTSNVPVAFATGMFVVATRLPDVGVPRAGVIRVGLVMIGLVLRTTATVPVLSATPVPPLATASVPATVTFPPVDIEGVRPVDPKDIAVTPVPAAGLVEIHADPVLVRTFPVVPGETSPVPPLPAGKVPVTPVVRGNPTAFTRFPDVGVPNAGVMSVGLVITGLVLSTFDPVPVLDVTPVPPLATGMGEERLIVPVTTRFAIFAVVTLAVVTVTFVNATFPLVMVTLANVMLLSVLTELPSWMLVLPRVIGVAKLASN